MKFEQTPKMSFEGQYQCSFYPIYGSWFYIFEVFSSKVNKFTGLHKQIRNSLELELKKKMKMNFNTTLKILTIYFYEYEGCVLYNTGCSQNNCGISIKHHGKKVWVN